MKALYAPLYALILTAASMAVGVSPAIAQDNSATTKQAPKKAAVKKKAPAKKAAAAKGAAAAAAAGAAGAAAIDEDDNEPDVSASATTDFNCELGNKLTIYRNAEDDKHIALRWKKQLRRLTRVETTTGANRFENRKTGWVWIDIPAKGMLLDSKKGQQLANECKNPEQMKSNTPEAVKS